jgi:hypothetical protein
MKTRDILLVLTTLFTLISCTERKKVNQERRDLDSTTIVKLLNTKTERLDTTSKPFHDFGFSSKKLKEIANRSEYKFRMLYDNNAKTLSICCAGEKFSNIFGSLEKDSLLSRYPFFEFRGETYKSFGETYKVTKYFYKSSFVKTFFYKHANSLEIACAKIVDDSIETKNKIKIGLDKKIFLSMLFDKHDIDYLAKYDTINIGEDETGEMDYYYIFRKEKLKTIIIDTACDWLDKELK